MNAFEWDILFLIEIYKNVNTVQLPTFKKYYYAQDFNFILHFKYIYVAVIKLVIINYLRLLFIINILYLIDRNIYI